MNNPFTCRGRIEDPDLFWGRKEDIRDVKTRLAGMQSVSLVGERRIGKSSLLYYFLKRGGELLGNDGRKHKFTYLTLEDARNRRLVPFLNHILQGIDGAGAIDINKTGLDALGEFADRIDSIAEWKIVVLLDEFDKFSDLGSQFPPEFFDAMRNLLQGGAIAMATASKKPLQDFSIANEISPFFNIFKRIDVKEFNEEERVGFVNRSWKGFSFTRNEIEFLLSLEESHPIKLQTLCYWLFENRENGFSTEKLKEKIEEEVRSYFPSMKDKIWKFRKRLPCKEDIKDLIDYYLKLKHGKE